jgi:hypothetical protein
LVPGAHWPGGPEVSVPSGDTGADHVRSEHGVTCAHNMESRVLIAWSHVR